MHFFLLTEMTVELKHSMGTPEICALVTNSLSVTMTGHFILL